MIDTWSKMKTLYNDEFDQLYSGKKIKNNFRNKFPYIT